MLSYLLGINFGGPARKACALALAGGAKISPTAGQTDFFNQATAIEAFFTLTIIN